MRQFESATGSSSRRRPGPGDWARVAVRGVHLAPVVTDRLGERSTVSASVELGAILPSDVVVVVRCDALDEPVRLFSTHPRGDGTFAFEAHIAAALIAGAQHLTVSVWPSSHWVPDAASAGEPLSSWTLSLPRSNDAARAPPGSG